MQVLLVEDEPAIADAVLYALESEGVACVWASTGEAALRHVRDSAPKMVLLDIGLPDINGLDLFRQIRAISNASIVFLTSRSSEIDQVLGLELGADDYICKPFSPREVVARVKAVLRRTATPDAETPALGCATAPALQMSDDLWQATLHGVALGLTRREFRLLKVLARQPGRIFSRAQLLDQAYDDTLDVNERAIDSHIKNLRKKLKAASGDDTDWIRSVYGVGFALEPAGPG